MTGSELSQAKDSRPWVRRLGSYLRIFGPPAAGTLGYRTSEPYLDSLIEMAKKREGEFGADAEGSASPAAVPEEET